MKIDVTEILYAFSVALDAVEGDLIGATTYHSQRVAYIAGLMTKDLDLTDKDRMCLAIACVLHDNALTQYVQEEIFNGVDFDDIEINNALGKHCAYGEGNVQVLPVYESIKKDILYHHERADGNGPFHKKPEEIPFFSRVIHMADRVDVSINFQSIDEEKFAEVIEHVKQYKGTIYDDEVADLFLKNVSYEDLKNIEGDKIIPVLSEQIPHYIRDYSSKELLQLAEMFAKIVDYKSPFTTRHSRGIAQKAREMGVYYGWDEETCDKLYFAGAVHDIGKLLVNRKILEKPDRLTDSEYKHIQNHAIGSYVILKSISGIDDIRDWAVHHHEKLDGSGYPFGKTADELNEKERLMACLDIYQALVEARPYKEGMPHKKAMEILQSMADKGQLDSGIVKDIDYYYG